MQGEIKKIADREESILIYNADKDIFCNQPVFPQNDTLYILVWSGSWKRDNIQKVKSSVGRQKHKVGKAKINTGKSGKQRQPMENTKLEKLKSI